MKKINRLVNFFTALCLVLGALTVIPVAPAYAAALIVNTLADENDHSCVDGDCSLRDALEVASAGDEISFSVTGTIILSNELSIPTDLTITGPGTANLTVSGNDATRIFYVSQNKTVKIAGMTITNGKPPVGQDLRCGGGAIYNDGFLTLDNMIITNSDATLTNSYYCKYPRAGGIKVWDYGSLTITNSTISNNKSYSIGGGIYFQSTNGTLSLTDVVISGNTSTDGDGGGLAVNQVNGTVKLERVTVNNNAAYQRGNGLSIGINGNGAATVAQIDIIDSYIFDNDNSNVAGAGVYVSGAGIVNIYGSLITNNTGGYGGGVSMVNSNVNTIVNITNSTISENSAWSGGGLYIYGDGVDDPTVNINNSSITGNTSVNDSGGIYVANTALVNLSNTILANNSASNSTSEDCSGTINSQDNNLIEIVTGCTFTGTTTHNVTGLDPNLSPLANNGGFTQTMSLGVGSPAIDAGDDTTCESTDQRGVTRPQGSHCDIGAYEKDSIPTFADVPLSHPFWHYIEGFYDAGITVGCSQTPRLYCPNNPVTRGEMAVFLLRGMYGAAFVPNPSQTGMFADVPYAVTAFTPWIEQFYQEGITVGCNQSPLRYCPQNYVTRGEMAVFIQRAVQGSSYQPNPSQTGMFADVPYPGIESFTPWIEQFYLDGITVGCNQSPLRYCPQNYVTRGEMAVFIGRAFGIPLP